MKPREMVYPVPHYMPTLLQVVAMETGRLAKYEFGKPTDAPPRPVVVPYRPEQE